MIEPKAFKFGREMQNVEKEGFDSWDFFLYDA